ncbi:hypothetical protein Tco_0883895 [Tanacetum coccineum]
MAKQDKLNSRMSKGSSQKEIRPVWNNVQRVNHQNQFVAKAVLTRTGKIQVNTTRTSGTNTVNTAKTSGTNTVNTARHYFNRQAVLTNAARKISTVKPFVYKNLLSESLNGDEKLARPGSNVLCKGDYSNLLIANILLKAIWFIKCTMFMAMKALGSPKDNAVACRRDRCKFKIESEKYDLLTIKSQKADDHKIKHAVRVLNYNDLSTKLRLQLERKKVKKNFISDKGLYKVGLDLQEYKSPSSDKGLVTMTKVIKEEFEQLGFLEINDGSLDGNTQLGTLCDEFNRLSSIDNDLFTYEIEVPIYSGSDKQASSPTHNDLEDYEEKISYEECEKIYAEAVIFINNILVRLIDVTVEQWLDLKYGNHMTMDVNVKKECEVAEIFRIETNVFDFETPTCRAFKEFNYLLQIDLDVLDKDIEGFKTYKDYKDDWIYEWNKDVTWVHKKPWMDNGVWKEPTFVKHYCKPFNYKSGCSEWLTYSWMNDGYFNGGNFPRAYVVGNSLRYQDFKRYDALEDGELKEEALKKKAIMEGLIDKDDESSKEERCELFDDVTQERPICNIRRFEMIKYLFRDGEEYVAVKENEYDVLTSTSKDACRTYQEIFRKMDEGWKDLAEKIDNVGEVSTI